MTKKGTTVLEITSLGFKGLGFVMMNNWKSERVRTLFVYIIVYLLTLMLLIYQMTQQSLFCPLIAIVLTGTSEFLQKNK